MNIKTQLYNACETHIKKKEATIEKIMRSNKNALLSETKSSAGDKHETGRAMLQLEMEKAGQQLSVVHQMKETLAKVNLASNTKLVHLGSLVITPKAKYFLSISVGQIKIGDSIYFAVSPSSPIGKILLGKQEGDILKFNGNTITIVAIH